MILPRAVATVGCTNSLSSERIVPQPRRPSARCAKLRQKRHPGIAVGWFHADLAVILVVEI